MMVIAGLGNPGRKYEWTRHNCGYAALDMVSERTGIALRTEKFHGLVGDGRIGSQKVLLVKPLTYMNLSGVCLREICSFYQINPEKELIVLHDDISLKPGQLRVRLKGSAGGHNGLKNIIEQLGTQNFMRVKIGVGEKPVGMDLADYVLSRFSLGEKADMTLVYDRAARAALALLEEDPEKVMSEYNAPPAAGDTVL